MSLVHRLTDFFNRKDRARAQAAEEEGALQEELTQLSNEARWQEEPSFLADLARKQTDLEREARILIFETQEPQRSQLQGRCQKLIEEIERPAAVQARIGEVRSRLRELRGGAMQPDDGVSVERSVAHS